MRELTKIERAALVSIAATDDPDRLRNYIANARRQSSAAVERAAFLRLCEVQPEANPGTVEHDVWQSIHALEEMLRDERGKTVRLTRSRQKIGRDGEAKTVSDLTMKADPSAGFTDLIERGHPELTFEAVVLRHPKTFDRAVQSAARDRLSKANVNVDELLNPVEGN
ncbi:hypothetical protein [Mesorhizobium sp. BE184]|uniref:hypothetical protein n=1 Tax=Mesorhizobium sp. BE184 TaxID=2817714 RepID=UPI0028661E5E|nr:hypothetical protein [Mesorhizobium sp. BE184]MDR7035005.1 hypothetical protein [Mesorhizobium sp. BE184]